MEERGREGARVLGMCDQDPRPVLLKEGEGQWDANAAVGLWGMASGQLVVYS